MYVWRDKLPKQVATLPHTKEKKVLVQLFWLKQVPLCVFFVHTMLEKPILGIADNESLSSSKGRSWKTSS